MNVRLRETADEDLALLFAFQAEPEGSAMAAVPSRDREAFDAHHARIRADGSTCLRTIEADGEVVGSVVAWDGDEGRMLGYWLGQSSWGRGIATAAVGAFLEIETARPLVATVVAHNVGSQRVLERNGFRLVRSVRGDDGLDELVYELG